MSKTITAPDMDALPPAGGSYIRLPDGSLVRTDDHDQVGQPTKPIVPQQSDPQE